MGTHQDRRSFKLCSQQSWADKAATEHEGGGPPPAQVPDSPTSSATP